MTTKRSAISIRLSSRKIRDRVGAEGQNRRLGPFALLRGDNQGQALAEMALMAPIAVLLLAAIWQFGSALQNQSTLVQAVASGAQTLQMISSTTTDPCADTFSAITGAAPALNSSQITLKLTINGSVYTGTSCPSATSQLAHGVSATVNATYPYAIGIPAESALSFPGLSLSGTFNAANTEIVY